MDFLVVQFLNGLASASSLFLVASGLSIIFGVSRIVNFAHGSFYMLGAYAAWTLTRGLDWVSYGPLGFWGGIVAAAVLVGLVGVAVEMLLLRRIYQLDFPTIYSISKLGIAKNELHHESTNLEPLFQAIVKKVPPPEGDPTQPFKLLVTTIDYSDYLGRLGIGKVSRGSLRLGSPIKIVHRDGSVEDARVTKIFTFAGLKRTEVEEADTGAVVALAGMEDVDIGETITDAGDPTPMPFVSIEDPTLSMNFVVNNSPLAGLEGKYVTTRHLGERLVQELRSNVSLRVELTDSPDAFRVSGRGELHLGILIETMRREGYEFQVSRPEVIFHQADDGALLEPYEEVHIETSNGTVGAVVEMLGSRRAKMMEMHDAGQGMTRMVYIAPTRGLLGFRYQFLTSTRGAGVMHTIFHGYDEMAGPMSTRTTCSLVAWEAGETTAYALKNSTASAL